MYGDDVGAVVLLKTAPKSLAARDLQENSDFMYIHKVIAWMLATLTAASIDLACS